MTSHATPLWRRFERIVAGIEQVRSAGAEIRSPDRLRDRITGRLREVDASIRVPRGDGGVELTLIECRRRGVRQDDPWIEQLASKWHKIGADRLIAVSSHGFSHSAILSAAHFGIELRTMTELEDPAELERLFGGYSIALTVTDFHLLDAAFVDVDGKEYAPSALDAYRQGSIELQERILTDRAGIGWGSLEGLIRRVGVHDVPINGPPTTKTAKVSVPEGCAFVTVAGAQVEVRQIGMVVRFWRYTRQATNAYAAEYSDPKGRVGGVLTGRAEAMDGTALEVTLHLGQ